MSHAQQFSNIDVPFMISQDQRPTYIALHYWDKFNFKDTTFIQKNNRALQNSFNEFINILYAIPEIKAKEALKNMIDKSQVEARMSGTFIQLSEKFLYDPNSPYLNEEFYRVVVENALKQTSVPQTNKVRLNYQLGMMNKNRVQTQATDFKYTLNEGTTFNLYSLKADYVLLLFGNPECDACKTTSAQLKKSVIINQFIKRNANQHKVFQILTVYPDADLDLWRKHISSFDPEWINAYNKEQTVSKNSLYDLRAIPTLYLLDKNKTVLLKDAALPQIEFYLSRLK
ncbi:DUF5106 domain-containing protein [Paludibacter sp.]